MLFTFGIVLLFLILFGGRSVDARLKASRAKTSVVHSDRRDEGLTRIVGGVKVQNNDTYPFFVNLGACAGALIHGDIVLTAAHVSSQSVHAKANAYSYDFSFAVYDISSPPSHDNNFLTELVIFETNSTTVVSMHRSCNDGAMYQLLYR